MKLKKIQNNIHEVRLGDTSIYFSYATPVAINSPTVRVVSKNIWSQTTARHINKIKEYIYGYLEVSNEEFLAELEKYKH